MRNFDWLAGLGDDVRAEMLGAASESHLAKDTLFQQGGEIATHVHQVVSGRVRQFILDENGNEILLHVFERGDVFGDTLGLGSIEYPLWLSTEDAVILRSWSAECFASLRSRHAQVSAAVDAQTARRFRIAITLLTDFATLDASGRVAGRLCHLARFAQGHDALSLDSSQEDLAMMSNVSRQTVNKVLAALTDLGVVEAGYGSILVKDLDGLKRYRDSHRRRP